MVFNVPFRGSLGLLILTLLMFITCIVGVGLFISGTVRTQQQAILGTFLFMVPAVTLSGYASPIENMPLWLQYVTWFNPLAHAMVAIKGLFLKNMSFGNLLPRLYPLAIISAGTLSLAAFNFAKKLE